MAHKAPGRSHRKGLSVKQLMKMFPTEEAARKWLESEIWPNGPYCPRCGSFKVQSGIGHSSMKLCRDLEITQKSAWHLMHRLRKTFETTGTIFGGPAKADETFIGGLEKKKHKDKKLKAGRGRVGKAIVAGVKDRDTNQVLAKVIPDTTAKTLQGFVEGRTETIAQVFHTDATGAAM